MRSGKKNEIQMVLFRTGLGVTAMRPSERGTPHHIGLRLGRCRDYLATRWCDMCHFSTPVALTRPSHLWLNPKLL